MGHKSKRPGVTRRDFIAKGGTAGVGVAALSGTGAEQVAAQTPVTRWDRTVDVVVVGAGAAGMPAAVRARDLGASVILIEENTDVGGHAIISNGITNIGGGTAIQKKYGIEDSADAVYLDNTRGDHPMTRFNDREVVRSFADHNVEVFDFLVSKGVLFRDAAPGNLPAEGNLTPRRTGMMPSSNDIKDNINNTAGSGIVRPLERAARAAGVDILLQHRMVRIVREQPSSGRVLGIVATDLANNRTVHIAARRGVIACTGGSNSNVVIRTIFDPKLTEEYQVGCEPYSRQSGDAEQLGMAVGASLGATGAQRNEMYLAIQKTAFIGCRYGYARWDPKGPYFSRAGAAGIAVADYQDVILVNMVGKRFYNEMVGRQRGDNPELGWRPFFDYFAAAMSSAIVEVDGKKHRVGGPIWAIFDADAVTREEWEPRPPFVDEANGYFFSASTLAELAGRMSRNPHQKYPMAPAALQETVTKYNSYVDTGTDPEFGKPSPKYKIQKPPFYAAWATPILHDCYSGLRVNGKWQVIDVFGKPIPGFYCAGESSAGMTLHGVSRCMVGGYVAATDAAGQRR
jgi:succinate dehydrogenase/fumarate reductase flavoprotein subunit